MRSGWLLRDGDVVCALEMTESRGERRRGWQGRDAGVGQVGQAGALHHQGARAVHTAARSRPVDVAFLSEDLRVLRLARLDPWRLALGRRGARSALEAEAGSMERWGIRVGDQLEIRQVP
jgi:uncharacterized membrane protein (UPF0127 family)